MAKTNYKTVDEFIKNYPKDVQGVLKKIRKTIREAIPEAEEVISYQIPAYKQNGFVIYFSVHAKHYSIAIPPSKTFEKFKKDLEPYKVSVSTVQFPKDTSIPYNLIAKMAKFKARENKNPPV